MSDAGYTWAYLLQSGLYNMKYLIFEIAIYNLIVHWAIFEKAFEPGWGVLVPGYNTYLYFKITWGNGWYFLLLLIPGVNVIILIITLFKLARAFGKSGWFALGLLFLGIVFKSVLAFGDPRYVGVPERDDSYSL